MSHELHTANAIAEALGMDRRSAHCDLATYLRTARAELYELLIELPATRVTRTGGGNSATA